MSAIDLRPLKAALGERKEPEWLNCSPSEALAKDRRSRSYPLDVTVALPRVMMVVAGTRIPVQSVLELVRDGLTFDEIVHEYYPDLSPEDIQACIQYAIDVLAVEDIHFTTAP